MITPKRYCIFAIISVLPTLVAANPGQKLYTTYCAACHAPDGKGATGGTFPPLAGSLWIQGKPDRAIQTVLHGLTGKVEVLGKTYNLVMPPQGAVLNDTQIASILTYVRSSWGHKEKPVTAAQVKAIRAATNTRNAPWKASELLKRHPLPLPESPISDLIRTTYEGKWDSLPDFSKLEGTSIEEEHHGILNLKNIKAKNHFGVVWEGNLHVPKDGTYTFMLDSDDESALYLAGKKITQVKGLGPLNHAKRKKSAKVALKKGTTPIRVEFFEYQGGEGISLGWKGPGIRGTQWMTTPPQKRKSQPQIVIDLTPKGNESVIYNNFLNGTTPRSLAIGHPNGTNFAFSTSHCAIELLWSGNFINAGQHWTSRGVGRTSPYGQNLVKLGNQGFVTNEPIQFKGYTMDKLRRPILKYQIGTSTIIDAPMPGKTQHQLVRTITVKGNKNLTFNAASGIPVTTKSDQTYVLDTKWSLSLSPNTKAKASNNTLTLQLTPGTHTLTYTLLP